MTNTDCPTVICAWCDRLLTVGGAAISHGICESCLRSMLSNLNARADTELAVAGRGR
jgi:hypothetical protein